MTVTFKPGYYEWLLYADEKLIAVFDDLIKDIPYPLLHRRQAEQFGNYIASCVEWDEYQIEGMSKKLFRKIVKAVKDEIWWRYRDDI